MALNAVTRAPQVNYPFKSRGIQSAGGDTVSRTVSAGESTAKNEEGRVIGFAALPYGNAGMHYGIKAQYAADSTESDPIVQVTSNYGGETTVYNVHINEVNPRRASQMEMFALLAYTDDQGISDGGSFGSYHQMNIYADNAKMNGCWEGNDTYDAFVNVQHDWQQVMITMWEEYANAGIYSQMQNCMNLNGTMEQFSIRSVDFDSIEFIDRSADTSLTYMGPTVPPEVARAWLEAAAEADANGMGMSDNGMFTHLSSMMVQRVQKRMSGDESGDVPGDSIQSALKAAREALGALEYPLTSDIMRSTEVQEEIKKEKAFYESFIRRLEALDAENIDGNTARTSAGARAQTGASGSSTATAAGVQADDDEEEELPASFAQMIHEHIEELFAKIKSGDTEPSFQIGSGSFTVTEWKEFLKKFDEIQDAIRKLIEEAIKERLEAQKKSAEAQTRSIAEAKESEENESAGVAAAGESEKTQGTDENAALHMLTAETMQARFPLQETDEDGNRLEDIYITAIDRTGIRCSKAGETGYEWEITFENEEQYERAVSFMNWAREHMDNFWFSAHDNFWKDLLSDNVDADAFKEFLRGTDNGVPNYAITAGDSMYIDRDKVQWAKYMNMPGAKFYTAQEFAALVAEEIRQNAAKLTKWR